MSNQQHERQGGSFTDAGAVGQQQEIVSRRRPVALAALGLGAGVAAACEAPMSSRQIARQLNQPLSGGEDAVDVTDVFNSIEELLNAPGAIPERLVFVLGYKSPGDGGGGVLYWDDASTKDNGGTVFKPANRNEPGRW